MSKKAEKKTEKKVKLENKAENIKKKTADSIEKMSSKLKALLEKDLEIFRKYEKTRAAEMLRIFASHNFYSGGVTPVEFRTTLEDLGPTYVKIGQIMSSRPDILPESYCKELEKLRQNVKPLDPQIARAVIEQETGKQIDEIYSEFRDEPLGSASIGQAHYAVLKDGTKVVTKVQRPLIEDMMTKDFVLMRKFASLINVVTEGEDNSQLVDLMGVLDELEKVSMEELDFRFEANNTKFFKENCIEDENVISCPTIIDELSTKRILTMTFVDGYTLAHKDKIVADGGDPEAIGTAVVNNYVHQVLDVGTYHADPHQGNIMVSHGKPYWIDFGMIGHLSQQESDLIQTMVLSYIHQDTEGLINSIMSLGGNTSKTNRDQLTQDVDNFMQRMNGAVSISDVNISELMTDVMDIATKNHIKLPDSYTLLARSIIAIEGVIEHLCPSLNLMKLISEKLVDKLKKNFDIKKTLMDAGKEIVGIGKKTAEIPGLAADALSNLAKGRTKVNMELSGVDEPLQKVFSFVKYVVLVLVACVLFTCACILCGVDLQPKTPTGIPLLSAALMAFSIALGLYAVIKMSKKK